MSASSINPCPGTVATSEWPIRPRGMMAGLMVLALAVRLAYLVAYSQSDWWDALIMDPGNHWELAGRIAAGEGMGPYAFFRAPLYLYLLAGLRAVLADSLWPIRIIQALMGSTVTGMIFVLGLRLRMKAGAVLAAIIYALWWVPIYFDGELLTESPATFLNALLLFLLVLGEVAGSNRGRWLAAAGLVAGLSAITRPNVLPFAAVAAVWLGWRELAGEGRGITGRWRRALLTMSIFSAGVALPIAPVAIRNLVVGDSFVLIASQGGINFWLGNHEGADGRTVVVPIPRREIPLSFLERRPDHPWLREDVWLASAYGADTALQRRSSEAEISDYWYGVARKWMLSHPGAELALTAQKALHLLQAREVSNNRDLQYHRRQFAVLRLSPFAFGWISPLALVGAGLACFPPWRRRLSWILLFVVFYGASVVMFFVTTRYRVPMLPAITLLAGFAVERMGSWLTAREWKKLGAVLALTLLLAVPVNVDWPAWNDRPLRSAMRYNLGIAMFDRGRQAAAEREFRAALEIKDNYPEAWFYLGLALGRQGRWQDAAGALEKSTAQGPGYAPAWYELSRAYAGLGRRAEADRALARARQLAPGTFGR